VVFVCSKLPTGQGVTASSLREIRGNLLYVMPEPRLTHTVFALADVVLGRQSVSCLSPTRRGQR